MQRNKQVAMGRKKFNMDPKKVSGAGHRRGSAGTGGWVTAHTGHMDALELR